MIGKPIVTLAGPAVAILMACVCGCGGQQPVPAPKDASHNVVLIVLDAVRASQLEGSRSGEPLMPRLRQFAAQSLCFTQAAAQATWTKPSVTSVLTSLSPDVHKIELGVAGQLFANQDRVADKVPEGMELAAELLKTAGYATTAVQTNANLRAVFGFGQGFDAYFAGVAKQYPADKIVFEAQKQLSQIKPPFFQYLHFMDAHAPYTAPQAYHDKFKNRPSPTEQDKALLATYNDYYLDRILVDMKIKSDREQPAFSEEGKSFIRFCYDAACRFLDDQVADYIASVQRDHPNTMFVVVADHGEEFWEHGSVGHAKTVYEELARVLLIVHAPGRAPERVDAPVELVDILPTVAAWCGINPRAWWQGRNLLADNPDTARPVFTQTKSSLREANMDLKAVRLGQWKLIRDDRQRKTALYNLASDPDETTPVDDAGRAAQLNQILDEYLARNAQNPMCPLEQKEQKLDPQTLEELGAAGYFSAK